MASLRNGDGHRVRSWAQLWLQSLFWGVKGTMANLDDIDRRLLSELQAEGRVTNVELAQRVGLTAPPCLRRVRGLEEDGVIRGYHADLDPSKLGFAITVFAMVSL